MNVVLVSPEPADIDSDEPILINRLGRPADELVPFTKSAGLDAAKQLIVTDVGDPDPHHPLAKVIRLPCSFATLQADVQELLPPNGFGHGISRASSDDPDGVNGTRSDKALGV